MAKRLMTCCGKYDPLSTGGGVMKVLLLLMLADVLYSRKQK